MHSGETTTGMKDLKAYIENADDPLLLIDRNGIIIDINTPLLSMIGHSLESAPGFLSVNKHIDALLDSTIDAESFNNQLYSHKYPTFRTWLKHRLSGKIYVSLSRLYLGDEYNSLGYYLFQVEIKRKSEKPAPSNDYSLQQALEAYDLLAAPGYVYYLDFKSGKLHVNNGLKELAQKFSIRDLTNAYNELGDAVPITNLIFKYDDAFRNSSLNEKDYVAEINITSSEKLILKIHKSLACDKQGVGIGIWCQGTDITANTKAEKELLRIQANLLSVIENRSYFIWSVDSEFQFILFNDYYREFIEDTFQYPLQKGASSTAFLPEKAALALTEAYRKVLNNKSFTIELQIKDYYFQASFNPILTERPGVAGVTVILNDITQRHISEVALAESEERFRQLAENINDAFILWDGNNIIYVNPAFEQIFEIKGAGLQNNPSGFFRKFDEENLTKLKSVLANLDKNPDNKTSNIIRANINGKPKLIWLRHYPIECDTKKNRFLTVFSDISEQKQLETSLEISKYQQLAIIDNIPYLAWLKDNSGKYLLVNEAFMRHYNLSAEEILGKTDFDICTKKDAERYFAHDLSVISSGRRQFFEEEISSNRGQRWMEIYKTPVLNDEGITIGLTGIARDITDRKRMEEAIIRNEEHFRSLLQYSSDSITIINENATITFESSLRNRISDFTIDELVGKNFTEIIHPDDIAIVEKTIEESLNNPGIQIKREYRSLHKNKRWIYVESIFLNHLHNPSIKGIVVNTRDISNRKMAELKERVYHDNLIFLSNSALDLLSLADRKDIYHYIAQKLHSFLSNSIVMVSSYNEDSNFFQLEKILGLHHHLDVINSIIKERPEHIRFNRNVIEPVIAQPGVIMAYAEDFGSITLEGIKKNDLEKLMMGLEVNKVYNIVVARDNKLLGNITILTLSKTIIKFKHIIETFVHQVAVALQRSQLEYELVQAKLRAEESDRLKTAFLANMSHEIRTPMNGILGFAEMLNDEKLDDESRKKYLDIINSNGKVLVNLIDDIIDFAKIEAGQLKTIEHDFSLNTLLNQIHTSFLSELLRKEKSSVELRVVKTLPDEACFITTDPNRLRQVITNLVGNAIKFTHQGYIEFGYHLEKNKTELHFFVKDTGIGIAADKLDHIFERFVQADSSRTRKYSGSGLGLAISRGISEILGGHMWAESVPGIGSTFHFVLPYISGKKTQTPEHKNKTSKAQYNWHDKKFLIAEDDLFSFKFLEGFLKQTKASIIHASDGAKAVELCKQNQEIDLILMDVQMPEMNGMDATRTIKSFRKEVPIIAQTANAIPEERQKCFEAGFDDFITKPINVKDLYAMIDKWLTK